MPAHIIVMFAEGDFHRATSCDSPEEARGFVAGFTAGADAYGAGSAAAYIIPEDQHEMKAHESPSAITTAHAAVRRLEAALAAPATS
jgi:hypothetical protein